MLAVWECRFRNQAPIGSCLHPAFSFDRRPTISRKPPSAFGTRNIHRPKILPHVTSCTPHQREKPFKHLAESNWTVNASFEANSTATGHADAGDVSPEVHVLAAVFNRFAGETYLA